MGGAAVPKKKLPISRDLLAIFDHVILDEPGMTVFAEMLGHLIQFLVGNQHTLESVDAMQAVTSRMLTLFALAQKIRTGLSSFVCVRRENFSVLDGGIL